MKRRRLSTGEIRNLERDEVRPLNDNGVYLPNPSEDAPFDRHHPITDRQKALAFGMEPSAPKRFYDLPPGDAGSGVSIFRRIHAFFSFSVTGSRMALANYTKALAVITNRSTNQKPKYFNVSFFGYGVRRSTEAGVPTAPLTNSEAAGLQFEQIYIDDGAQTPLTPRFIPSVCTCQGRIMVHDESGQRFFDVDVIGNRTVSVYAFGVSAFVLVKEDGYEVDEQNPEANAPLDDDVAVEDDIIGCRVLPVKTNVTKNNENRTISVFVDASGDAVPGIARVVPVPPGAVRVQIFSTEPVAATPDYGLRFWTGRANPVARPDLGVIDWEPGQSKTAIVEMVNASAIAILPRFNPGAPTPSGFSLVFEVES